MKSSASVREDEPSSFTPIIEQLLKRVTTLEEQMKAMFEHQHQYLDTRPVGYGSMR